MSDYYCPNCGADLEEQPGFDPNGSYWTCTNCGTLLTDPSDPDMDTASGVTWFCDCCGACLNKQDGFDESYSSWTCTECGHENSLSEDNIYSSEDEYQNSITHYNCPNCGAELNRQSSFYEEEEYTCESCGTDLYKNGDMYEKRYTCPNCGDTLNSQWSFNSWSGYCTCSSCGRQLHKSFDEYEKIEEDQEEEDDSYESDSDDEEENQESYDESTYERTDNKEPESTSNEDFSRYYQATFHGGAVPKKKSFGRRHWKGILLTVVLALFSAGIAFGVYEYGKLIPIGIDSVSLTEMQCEDAVALLQKEGFSNVATSEIEDLEYEDRDEEGTIKNITVQSILFLPFLEDGGFSATVRFPYDSIINIEYHGLVKLSAPISSKDAKKQNYKDIQKLFKDSGFVNVKTERHEDLITGWINKDGAVENTSIDGETKFGTQDKFRPDTEVIITYHAFKQ